MFSQPYTELFDEHGNLMGVVLSPEAWDIARKDVVAKLAPEPKVELRPEPVREWEYLLEYWDFPYEPDYDVVCDHCGNATDNWKNDDPRKFRLSSANLAGLVAFQCQQCQAKVVKRHFKDEITTQTIPHQEEKNPYKEAHYNK